MQKIIEEYYPGMNNGLNQEMTGHGALDFARFAVDDIKGRLQAAEKESHDQ